MIGLDTYELKGELLPTPSSSLEAKGYCYDGPFSETIFQCTFNQNHDHYTDIWRFLSQEECDRTWEASTLLVRLMQWKWIKNCGQHLAPQSYKYVSNMESSVQKSNTHIFSSYFNVRRQTGWRGFENFKDRCSFPPNWLLRLNLIESMSGTWCTYQANCTIHTMTLYYCTTGVIKEYTTIVVTIYQYLARNSIPGSLIRCYG